MEKVIDDYNNSLKDESFVSYLSKKIEDETIVNATKYYADKDRSYLPYVADYQCSSLLKTYNLYASEIDKSDVSNETKMLMKDALISILKIANNIPSGMSCSNILKIINEILLSNNRDRPILNDLVCCDVRRHAILKKQIEEIGI